MSERPPVIAVLGASGLIGRSLAERLLRDGFEVVAIARGFTTAQAASFGPAALQAPIASLAPGDLAQLLAERNVGSVVNCLGVLQDGPQGGTGDVHTGFAQRLVKALQAKTSTPLLIQVSIPGRDADDHTAFSTSKREAERLITSSTLPYVILRPGFVMADNAFGGSALIRALASTPFSLPPSLAARPFATTSVDDIFRTVAFAAQAWVKGRRDWRESWDVMERTPRTVGEVVDGFRRHFGGPAPTIPLPLWTMWIGAKAGDLAAYMGWSPPIRSTALREMMRGVRGDPGPWTEATAIEPSSLEATLKAHPATIQENWFARLYLLKSLVLGSLVIFWAASGLIALTVAFDGATAILTVHGFPTGPAKLITAVTSLCDVTVGLAIGWRRTCRWGLRAGIALSGFYMLSAALITPELWAEPLGALVKTVPAILLMIVALATLDNR